MDTASSYRICVLGSANSDLFLRVHHIPKEGETIQAIDSFIKNGGKGANQAVAAVKLGGKTIFAGQMGKDSMAQLLCEEMTQAGVSLESLRSISDTQTGQAIIMLDEKGQNSIVIIGAANMMYKDLSILPEEQKKAINNSLIIQLQKEIPMQINILAAVYAKKSKKLVMLDCGGRDDPFPEELLQNIDFLSPNETELARAMNEEESGDNVSIDKIRSSLLTKYPNLNVVLKLGSRGSAVLTQKLYVEQKIAGHYNKQIAQDQQIVDTTGAGDCFSSAFCVKFTELNPKADLAAWDEKHQQENYRKCLLFANCCAFLCITKLGAMPSMPQRSEVDAFISKYLGDKL